MNRNGIIRIKSGVLLNQEAPVRITLRDCNHCPRPSRGKMVMQKLVNPHRRRKLGRAPEAETNGIQF
jgi:hypothetical protein